MKWKVLSLVTLLGLTSGVAYAAKSKAKDSKSSAFLTTVNADLAKLEKSIEASRKLVEQNADNPLLPELRLRLAELYVQKSRLLYYRAVEQAGGNAASVVAPDSKYFKERAVEQYQRIAKDFPDFQKLDKVLFFMAHEYQELGHDKVMLETYTRLGKDFPNSPFVNEALLIVGNHYAAQKDVEGAAERYKAILKRTDRGVAALARYKLGWIHLQKEEFKEAMELFTLAASTPAVEGSDKLSFEQEKLAGVRREALVDSVLVFTEVKKPSEALDFYEKLSEDRFVFGAVLDKLANRYFLQKEYAVSADMYRRLLAMTQDPNRSADYARRLYDSVTLGNDPKAKQLSKAEADKRDPRLGKLAKKKGDKAGAAAAVPNLPVSDPVAEARAKEALTWSSVDAKRIAEAAHLYISDWRVGEKERAELKKEYEVLVRDVATKVHVAAQKAKNRDLLAKAADAYTAYLEVFDENTKNRTDVELNYAEALYGSRQYLEAGRTYERIARGADKPSSKLIHDALTAYQKVATNADADPFMKLQAYEGIKTLGTFYLREDPKAKDAPEVAFMVARSYFDQGLYDDAVKQMAEYIKLFPGHANSYKAALIALDAYARREDFDGLIRAGKNLMQDERLPDPKFRAQVSKMVDGAESRRVDDVIAVASSGAEAEAKLKALATSGKASGTVAEKALFNLYVQARDRRDIEGAFTHGEAFIKANPKHANVAAITGELAKFSIDMADFKRAAAYYEHFARIRPDHEAAKATLDRAAEIRGQLGDLERLEKVHASMLKLPGAAAATSADVLRNELEVAVRTGQWAKANGYAQQLLKAGNDGPFVRWAIGWSKFTAGQKDALQEDMQAAFAMFDGEGNEDDRRAAGHAAFIAATPAWTAFETLTNANEPDAVNQKFTALQAMEEAFTAALSTGSGEWGVAALYKIGVAYSELAPFIEQAPVPDGLNPEEQEQYKQIIAGKVVEIRGQSESFFQTCLQKASELDVFSPYVTACATKHKGSVPGLPSPPEARQNTLAAATQDALRKSPGDVKLLKAAGIEHLKAGDPYSSELVLRRALEDAPDDAEMQSALGVALVRRGAITQAFLPLKEAADIAPGDAKMKLNLAAHYFAFGDPAVAKKTLEGVKLTGLDLGAADVHPSVKAMLQSFAAQPQAKANAPAPPRG